ncbi:hypothetical protein [Arcobacter sp.]|uniref:hypothetical protein n=1 Tax=Arcobacter sp. TaxID=1872629 RepID=UPI003D13F90F
MNLPHQKPIRFINNIVDKTDTYYIINCTFPYIPTLAMVCEAAAQSAAAFAQENDKPIIGFLISLKNVKILSKFVNTKYKVKIEKTFNFGTMTEYKFELIDELNCYAMGELTIALDNKNNL